MDDKRYLGPLCKRGHDYEGSGKSLRFRSNRGCVVCSRERTKAWFKTERGRDYSRDFQREQFKRPEVKQRSRDYARSKAGKAAHRRYRKSGAIARKHQERMKNDEQYRVASRLRNRLRHAIADSGSRKTRTADEYGVDYAAIATHLGPCPGPRRDWHIDHILPLASFDLSDPEQVRQAFRPENHRWIPAFTNRAKGDKIEIGGVFWPRHP